jgi:hypothetical protein
LVRLLALLVLLVLLVLPGRRVFRDLRAYRDCKAVRVRGDLLGLRVYRAFRVRSGRVSRLVELLDRFCVRFQLLILTQNGTK